MSKNWLKNFRKIIVRLKKLVLLGGGGKDVWKCAYVMYGWLLKGKAKLVKTSVILNDLNPKWNESYRTEVCHFADHLSFEIRDKVCILEWPKEWLFKKYFCNTLRNNKQTF